MRAWVIGVSALALSACGHLERWSGQAETTAASPARYDLSFDNRVHREARISVTYDGLNPGPVRFRMSRSSPGRYALHEFAKNVYSVTAVDGAGQAITVERSDPYSWVVPRHDGTVTLSYTLFADRADGTYSQIDTTHAHLNMPATMMWAEGQDARPVEVRFNRPESGWKIATQLAPTSDPELFTAPDLQYLMDSPTEISAHTVREWTVDDAGVPRTIRIALHHNGTEAEADEYAARAKKVVDAQIAIFGDVPDFDHGTYTFLADYLPHVSGDGMEHRNSTIISTTRGLAEANYGQISTLSHEFFHSWNVERLRPAELEPFDYTRANPTPSLWLAEGFTNYYGPLAIRRAGVSTVDAFLASMGGQMDFILNNPALAYGTPQDMSLRAAFEDAAAAIDPNNPNIFATYYLYGATIAMGLDLELRQRFDGVTLDHYMRHLWRKHGVTEKPYTPDDLRVALAEVTGDRTFADNVFDRWVEGTDLPEFKRLFEAAGIVMRPRNATAAFAGRGLRLAADDAGVVVLDAYPAPGSPIYQAGIDRGDEIVSVAGNAIDSQADWTAALAAARPGDVVEVRFIQRGFEKTTRMTLSADPSWELVRIETTGVEPTGAQRAFRDAWLGVDTAA